MSSKSESESDEQQERLQRLLTPALLQKLEANAWDISILPPPLREMFERDLENGTVQQILDPWTPWWCKQLVNDEEEDEQSLQPFLQTVPKFHDIYKRSEELHLQYNILDILFATIYTLRLYNGEVVYSSSSELLHHDIFLEPAKTFVTSSAVLSQMRTSFEGVEQVLSSCVSRSMEVFEPSFSYVNLLDDLHEVVRRKVFVFRLLKSACKILKSAIQNLRSFRRSDGIDADDRDVLNNFKRVYKKVEFYVAWSIENWETRAYASSPSMVEQIRNFNKNIL